MTLMPAIDVPRTAALDTNILLYVEGLCGVDADIKKIALANELLDTLYASGCEVVIPVQVLCEMHNGFRRKLKLSAIEAGKRIARLKRFVRTAATSDDVFADACDLAEAHSLQTYDAIILAAAASSACEILFSEDLQHGFEWGGVRIINPFL